MREIVIDTETTGLNFKAGDRIIEVGCVELMNHVTTGNKLNFYCKINKTISKEAEKISGITNEFLKDKKTFSEQYNDFLDFIKGDTLVIHNADFDMGFINNELKAVGKESLKNNVIDTVSLARKVLNSRIANLDYLCRHFNIDLSKRKLHGALLDAELLAEVYLQLRGGKQISMDLTTKEKNKETQDQNHQKKARELKKVKFSEENLKQHKLMIKKLKEAIWNNYDY